ncbi:Hypothetical predicted protein [Lecanosticta acicola]|uniref:Uncharacterized protein n=1 Tax=Lecanosticta acicola TaxID=111012 RepID=A0AAI8Z583_9PEZI|nr:Hypothetical predicted protein [Lecanosticta acicola]
MATTPTAMPQRLAQDVRYRRTPAQSTAQPPSGHPNFDLPLDSVENERHADHGFADLTRRNRLPTWARDAPSSRHGGGSPLDKFDHNIAQGSGCLSITVILLIIVMAFAFAFVTWQSSETQEKPGTTQLESTNMPSYKDLAAKLATLTDAFNIQTELNEVPVNIDIAAGRLTELHMDYCPVPHHIIPGMFLNRPKGSWSNDISELDAVSCNAVNGLVVDIRKAKHETNDIQAELGAGVVLDVSLIESLRQKFQPSLPLFSSSPDSIDPDTGLLVNVPPSQQQLELITQVSDIVTATFARRRSAWETMRFEARRGEALLTQLSHHAAIAQRQVQTQSKRLDAFCGGSYRRGTGGERIKNGIASITLSLLFSDTKAKLHYCGQTRKHSRAMSFAIGHTVQEIEIQRAVFQMSSDFFWEMETFWQTLKTDAGEVEKRALRERVRGGGGQDASIELASYVEHDLSRAFAQARRTEQIMRQKRDKMEALKAGKTGHVPFAQIDRREL